ncbi:peptide deformylase [Terrihabitans soli]|uniref:Peptide deformylase n=2 Tax=Terrihabitans soli TaxID=708113 RepID=A0A6S6QVN5_9HYPH|nr:peptide deformylase [Terrihabitans soli]
MEAYLAVAMTIRPILVIPDEKLRQQTELVTAFDAELQTLIEDMFETMYAAPGIGLAAPQIGVMKRLCVVDVSKRDDEEVPMALINPQITWSSEETSLYEEGCLSIPDYYEEVERPAKIRVSYQDRAGKAQEIEADGVLATCIQHEIDHLDGVLFIDHISKLKRDMVWKKYVKLLKRDGPQTYTPKPKMPPADDGDGVENLGEL